MQMLLRENDALVHKQALFFICQEKLVRTIDKSRPVYYNSIGFIFACLYHFLFSFFRSKDCVTPFNAVRIYDPSSARIQRMKAAARSVLHMTIGACQQRSISGRKSRRYCGNMCITSCRTIPFPSYPTHTGPGTANASGRMGGRQPVQERKRTTHTEKT